MYRYFLPLFLIMMVSGCASYSATSGRVVIKDDTSVIDVRISDHDRSLIENYYKKSYHKKKGLPPGLAKRDGNLPPGLAKRDKLPPGLRGDPLPYDLEENLSRLPSTHVRVRVGQDIVLMDRKTRVIIDVIYEIAY
ncbi:MAG: hypothetical protein OEM48_05670 [Gammaproteobacteria bacterium]|nr:hypothetical protein [Gammaproteobacteria bacterium]MDH3371210.1 hypothetical protein [Gammaproteobacteria bacterium]MDH3406412.1 hypothetical protein [Gammaproteobacteria bacterium]MDH5487233.1 hypothetical protein [Gammaproteobacteria bacterium]